MSQFIVKVQMPIASNHDEPEVMVYNEDRSVMQQFPLSDDLREIMGEELKKYFYAHTGMDGFLHLDGEAPAQEW
jgi:hypothetical protein